MTILETGNFLFCKLVTIMTNNFWSLELVINEIFFSGMYKRILIIPNHSYNKQYNITSNYK